LELASPPHRWRAVEPVSCADKLNERERKTISTNPLPEMGRAFLISDLRF